MFRSILATAATISLAALAPSAPVFAQDGVRSSITVTAPAIRNAGEPANGVQQRKQLVANVRVETGDLDLRTAYGRALLDSRIRLAADAACDQLDQIEPPSGPGGWNPDAGNCRHLAMKRAEPRMWAAIRAAG